MGGNRVLVLGEAVAALNVVEDGASVLLLDRERPNIPTWLVGAQARSIDEYRTEDFSYVPATEEADRLITRWADAKDSRGRRLGDIASYKGIPLWESVEVNFLYGILAALLDELRLWERILDVEQPSRLLVPPGSSGRVAAAAATARGILVQLSRSDSPSGKPSILSGRAVQEVLPPIIRAFLRRWRGRVRSWRGRSHHSTLTRYRAELDKARRILVLTLVRRFVEIVIPVIHALERDPINCVLVVDRNFSTATSRLEAEGIPYRIFEGYSTTQVLNRVRLEEKRFRQEWNWLSKDQTFRCHFAVRKADLWPLIQSTMHEYFTALFPELVRVIEMTWNLLQREQPAVVVLTDERPPFQRAFILACRARGVPSVGIQDTLFPDLPYGHPIATDWIAVDGEMTRANLVKRGTPAEKIVVTGQPQFDCFSQLQTRFDRKDIATRLSFDPAYPIVLLISQYAGIYLRAEDKRRALQAIYSAMATMPDLQLVVKLHPDDPDGSVEREMASAAGLGACRILRSGETQELILASDLVIVFFSTVGHEAILMDRPVIQIPTGAGEGPAICFTEDGGALEGSPLEGLPALIKAALYGSATQERLRKGREAYIRRHGLVLDGRSTERVAELVMRVADTQGRRRGGLEAKT